VVPGGLENDLKIVGVGSGSFRRSNDMKGEEMVIPGAKVALARRKCTIYGAHALGLV